MNMSVVGIDLGKQCFHEHGVDEHGRTVVQKKLTRAKLSQWMANVEPCLVGMEACDGAHDWARLLQRYGHEVRLMSPPFVKPYVKSNKNEYLDAEAIGEAVTRPNMRFVPIKSVAQQALQQLHRARSQAVAQRTAQANQIRGFLLEYGMVVPQGMGLLRRRLPELLEDAENGLPGEVRALLAALGEELRHLDQRVQAFDRQIEIQSQQQAACRQLQTIPGISPLIATALVAAVGDATVFIPINFTKQIYSASRIHGQPVMLLIFSG